MFFTGSNDTEVVSYSTQCGASSSAHPDMPTRLLARQEGQGRIKWRNTWSLLRGKVKREPGLPIFEVRQASWFCQSRAKDQAGRLLRITVPTMKAHMKNIMGKTKSSARTGILAQVLCP